MTFEQWWKTDVVIGDTTIIESFCKKIAKLSWDAARIIGYNEGQKSILNFLTKENKKAHKKQIKAKK
jgi:hypothetical protein